MSFSLPRKSIDFVDIMIDDDSHANGSASKRKKIDQTENRGSKESSGSSSELIALSKGGWGGK